MDGNGRVQVTDPIALLDVLFFGAGPLRCEDAADSNDDGKVNVTDVIALLDRLFLGGQPLPPPEGCGVDTAPDLLAECPARC